MLIAYAEYRSTVLHMRQSWRVAVICKSIPKTGSSPIRSKRTSLPAPLEAFW